MLNDVQHGRCDLSTLLLIYGSIFKAEIESSKLSKRPTNLSELLGISAMRTRFHASHKPFLN